MPAEIALESHVLVIAARMKPVLATRVTATTRLVQRITRVAAILAMATVQQIKRHVLATQIHRLVIRMAADIVHQTLVLAIRAIPTTHIRQLVPAIPATLIPLVHQRVAVVITVIVHQSAVDTVVDIAL